MAAHFSDVSDLWQLKPQQIHTARFPFVVREHELVTLGSFTSCSKKLDLFINFTEGCYPVWGSFGVTAGLNLVFVFFNDCYLVLAAAKSTWFLFLFNLAGGGFSRWVTIGWVRGTWHLSFLGHPLCWPSVWNCRKRSKIRQTMKGALMASLKQNY